ncbi:PREDICTED: tetraspanin-4 isoform X1 [Sturnus vulgaris]|uniref:tetraspanin-4 isoform X1 n=1 Tax=Sturnus vulgaris TaxID=9172 RepID=UPI00071A10D8|nr:PREDICTED: tetraspanin-4 isoform X1 [Sturnus vulgaris]
MILAGRGREKGIQGIFLLLKSKSVPWRKEHEADTGPALSSSPALSLVTFAYGTFLQQELLCAGTDGCGVTGRRTRSPVCWLPPCHLGSHRVLRAPIPPSELKRCSMAHNCLQCIKYLMFVFNLLFWLGGCGILGVGIWLAVTQGNFATLSSSFPSLSAANLLIVTGTFVMIIGFVGCIGAIKENKCLLLSFFIMLLIIFLLELTVVILFFVYTDKIDKYAQRDLKKGLHLYGTDGNIGLTNAWSIIQTDFRCCGVSNYTDWFEVYNTTRVPDSCCLEFSENCGLHSPGTWWKAPCYETVKIWLQENLLAVGIFGLCTAMVQILGLTFAMTMYCQVVKADTYCA